MILTCKQAEVILVQEWNRDDRPQALFDFLNDCGARISGGRLWCRNAEEPPKGVKFAIPESTSLHYVERDDAGKLKLRRQTCTHPEVMLLLSAGAGVGTLSVAAQLYRTHKNDPNTVKVIL